MKKIELILLTFERGDYVETFQGFFIYLGNSLWLSRDTHALYKGKNQYTIPKERKDHRIAITLSFICEGDVVTHLLKGIPEQKDIYARQ